MKKILIFLLMIFTINVYAEKTVMINGGSTNIYDGGSGSAIFNNTTNTLTLNEYNGGYIQFSGFDNNETINIILNGENIITGDKSTTNGSYGISIPSSNLNMISFNINGETGSTLTIDGFYNSIRTTGSINIENANIKFTNFYAGAIYTDRGDLISIKNTTLVIEGDNDNNNHTNIGITTGNYGEGNVKLDKVNITSTNQDLVISVKGNVEILNDSVINVTNAQAGAIFSNGNITIKKTTITGNDGHTLIYGIPNTTIVNIEDSNISATEYNNCINNVDIINIKNNSNIDITSSSEDAITAKTKITIDNSSFTTTDSVALVLKSSNIELNKSTYESTNSKSKDFYCDNLTISNSILNIENSKGTMNAEKTINIKDNTKITANKIYFLATGEQINIENSTIESEDYETGVIGAEIISIRNSNLDIKSTISNSTSFALQSTDDKLTIDNSNISIETNQGATIVYIGEDKTFDEVIQIKNAKVRETNLIKGHANAGGYGVVNGFFKEELTGSEDIMQLFDKTTKIIHIDTINNPKTGDNIIYNLIITILVLLTLIQLIIYRRKYS